MATLEGFSEGIVRSMVRISIAVVVLECILRNTHAHPPQAASESFRIPRGASAKIPN